MKSTIVYKLVYPYKGMLLSGFTSHLNSSGLSNWRNLGQVLEYRIGKETVPRFGKIFAFDTLNAALNYGSPLCLIYEAKTRGKVVRSKSKTVLFGNADERNMRKVWGKKGLSHIYLNKQSVPIGTVLCNNLTLVREIH